MPQLAERPTGTLIRAKAQQFAQTERVRRLHSALLLSEVEKQREAQIDLKQRLLRRKKLEDTKVAEEIERLWEHHLWEQAMKEQAKQQKRQNLRPPPDLPTNRRDTMVRAAAYAKEQLEKEDLKKEEQKRSKEEQKKHHPTSQEIEKLWKQLEEQNAREAGRIQQGVFEKLFAAQREKERGRRLKKEELFEKIDPDLTERVVYGNKKPGLMKKFGSGGHMDIGDRRQETMQKQRNKAEQQLSYEPKRGYAFDQYAPTETESQEIGFMSLPHNLIDPNDPRLTYARQYSDITKDTSTAIFEDWKNNLRKYNILKRSKRVMK